MDDTPKFRDLPSELIFGKSGKPLRFSGPHPPHFILDRDRRKDPRTNDHYPLTRRQVADILAGYKEIADICDGNDVIGYRADAQIRLEQAIPGMTRPWPPKGSAVRRRVETLLELIHERASAEGASDALIDGVMALFFA